MTGDGEVDVALVRRLLADQAPEWADLAIEPVTPGGWDNRTFRLGSELVVRLPLADAVVPQVAKEHHWLPVLAAHVPVPIPVPRLRGGPGCGFARPWSVHGWIDGRPAGGERRPRPEDLAAFIAGLQRAPTIDGDRPGPGPGPHCHDRGGPLATVDDAVQHTIERLRPDRRIDLDGVRRVWSDAVSASWDGPAVWAHGDLTGSNLLVDADGRLTAVIDFGCAVVGDPACDLVPAWTAYDAGERRRFLAAAPGDDAMVARARGWALWKAIKRLPELPDDDPRNDGTRLGWRWPARQVVEHVLASAP